MTRRTRAREVALQLLFWRDANPGAPREAVERFLRERLRDPAVEPYGLELVDGVAAHQADIDARLTEAAENWRLARMAAVDRNVLRLGAFELLQRPETPPAVVINEAVELARRYGAKDSPAFVNGVLDRVHRMRNAESELRVPDAPPPPVEPPVQDVHNPQSAIRDPQPE
jgi:N utilization substance protein B